MAKPEEINWANGGTGSQLTPAPSDTKRLAGWAPFEPPPASFVNYFWNLIQRWFEHLNGAGTQTDLSQAISDLTDGGAAIERTFILDEKDTDQRFGTTNVSITTTNNPAVVAVTGKSVLYSEGNAADPGESISRDLVTPIATYTKTGGLTMVARRIISDGVVVAMCYNTFVELFDHDTGATIWLYDHAAAVNDIAMDGTHIYLVGAAGTGTHHARALVIASGGPTVTWSYDHGAELFSVATNGRQVFVAGAASIHASLATMRSLEATTGNDLLNEGGTAADTTLSAWDIIQPVPVDGPAKLATDGRSVWVGLPAGAAVDVERRWASAGGAVAETAVLTATVTSLTVDQKYLMVSAGIAVFAVEKQSLATFWLWKQTNSLAVSGVATDGGAVFAVSADAAGVALARIWRGNTPGLWRRVDIGDDYLPYRQLAIPTE